MFLFLSVTVWAWCTILCPRPLPALLLHTHFREAAVGQSDNCIPLCFHAATPALLQSDGFFWRKIRQKTKKQNPLKEKQKNKTTTTKRKKRKASFAGTGMLVHITLSLVFRQTKTEMHTCSLPSPLWFAGQTWTDERRQSVACLAFEGNAAADTEWRRLSRLTVSERRFVHQWAGTSLELIRGARVCAHVHACACAKRMAGCED